jgi:putative endonuclease
VQNSSRRSYFVYILSSQFGVLYVGMTNDLVRRMEEHLTDSGSQFAKKYHVSRLIYWEEFREVEDARRRENQIKSWRRSKKLALVRGLNPTFRDLSEEIPV